MDLTPSFWTNRRVLVTGSTGFKGAWLSLWLEHLGASVCGLSLQRASEHGAHAAFSPWTSLQDNHIDIRDSAAVARCVEEAQPEIIFHLAAQALVLPGFRDPIATYATNVMGTLHLLEATKAVKGLRAVVVVTSDKVYRNDGDGQPFVETDALGGADPYSSSKACAELVVSSWRHSFGDGAFPLITVRAGNVIGGGDDAPERLLPDLRRAIERGRPIELRHPQSTRPWQHVLDPLHGYLLAAAAAADGRDVPTELNFGPPAGNSQTVAHVAEMVFDIWGEGEWVQQPGEHVPEAALLALDATLAQQTLGWRPRLDLAGALAWTVDWWKTDHAHGNLRALALAQIERFETEL